MLPVSFDSIGSLQRRLQGHIAMVSPSIPDAGSAERPRVLLADDHTPMLALTADALAGECFVVGRAVDGYELLAETERLHPDVIALEITMPRLDGIERRASSGARTGLPVSSFSVHEDADYARAALDAGGLGYFVKSRLASDLLPAIRAALADRPSSHPPCPSMSRINFCRSQRETSINPQKPMKQILTPLRILSVIALALAAGCATPQSKENSLVAAGFHVIVPKTAAQQKLKALPHDRVTMVQEKGKTYYVFPDAAHHQAYVGGPKQYETYRQLRLKQKEKVEAAEMNQDTSTDWGFGASGLGSYSGRVP